MGSDPLAHIFRIVKSKTPLKRRLYEMAFRPGNILLLALWISATFTSPKLADGVATAVVALILSVIVSLMYQLVPLMNTFVPSTRTSPPPEVPAMDRWAEGHERAARGDPALSPDLLRDPRYRRREARAGVDMHLKWEALLDRSVPLTSGGQWATKNVDQEVTKEKS